MDRRSFHHRLNTATPPTKHPGCCRQGIVTGWASSSIHAAPPSVPVPRAGWQRLNCARRVQGAAALRLGADRYRCPRPSAAGPPVAGPGRERPAGAGVLPLLVTPTGHPRRTTAPGTATSPSRCSRTRSSPSPPGPPGAPRGKGREACGQRFAPPRTYAPPPFITDETGRA